MFLAGRRVHRQLRQDLQHVVLHHIADGTCFVIEMASVLNPEVFGHGNLDAADVVAVPQRLEHRIGETCVGDVLYWLLTQIVVNAEDVFFGKVL